MMRRHPMRMGDRGREHVTRGTRHHSMNECVTGCCVAGRKERLTMVECLALRINSF
jgi:hypothetical protein